MWFLRQMKLWILDILVELKHSLSPERFRCLANGGMLERGARVFTAFPGTISFGRGVKIGRDTTVSNYDRPGRIEFGDGASIGWHSDIYGMAGVKIGRNVLTASYLCILTANHGYEDVSCPIKDQPCTYAPVEIGDDTWIGYRVTILRGVKIGKHVVIGAGSVVTKDLPDFSVCAGVPCKVIRLIGK